MKQYIVNLIILFLPPSRLFALKRILLRWAGHTIGSNVRVMNISVTGVKLIVGDNTFIGEQTMLTGTTGTTIRIGRNCDISSRVNIFSGTHHKGSIEQAAGEGYGEDIVIEDGTWIGFASSIMPGAHIGKGAIVAACSCVKDEVQPGTLVAGIPAKFKKQIFDV